MTRLVIIRHILWSSQGRVLTLATVGFLSCSKQDRIYEIIRCLFCTLVFVARSHAIVLSSLICPRELGVQSQFHHPNSDIPFTLNTEGHVSSYSQLENNTYTQLLFPMVRSILKVIK